jgi:predicted nucleotidyltransferase
LIETAKRALAKGELEIAGKFFVKAIRTGMLDNAATKSPEPYFYLAEVLEKRAEDTKLELLQKQRYLLQAAALYNFVRSFLKSTDTNDELSKKLPKLVSLKLLDIQDNLITLCGGNPLQSRLDAERKRNELENLRNEVKESLESLESRFWSTNQGGLNESEARQMFKDQTEEVKTLSGTISNKMKQFFASIIDECLALLGAPPCDYEVIVFGSLARDETTPYSDFEWAILTSSEEEKCKVFFRHLTHLVHLQVGKVFETYVECSPACHACLSLLPSSTLLQDDNNLFQTCHNNWEQAVRMIL